MSRSHAIARISRRGERTVIRSWSKTHAIGESTRIDPMSITGLQGLASAFGSPSFRFAHRQAVAASESDRHQQTLKQTVGEESETDSARDSVEARAEATHAREERDFLERRAHREQARENHQEVCPAARRRQRRAPPASPG
jgi:hypothetical protein